MPRKQTPTQAKKAALESDYAALYAVAGLTDALADALKSALAETQEKANKRLTDLQSKRSERTKQAKDNADEVRDSSSPFPSSSSSARRDQGPDCRVAEAGERSGGSGHRDLRRTGRARQARGRRGPDR